MEFGKTITFSLPNCVDYYRLYRPTTITWKLKVIRYPQSIKILLSKKPCNLPQELTEKYILQHPTAF
jgi:hypothetical protein